MNRKPWISSPSARARIARSARLGATTARWLVVAMLVTGCVNLISPTPALYTLTPKSTFADTLTPVDWQLLVEPPVAQAGLNTVRIALSTSPHRLDYFAEVAWTDRAPNMIQRLIVESFENSGNIVSVGRETVGLRADYVLKTELREFQAEYDGSVEAAPSARVRLNAKLVQIPERTIIASENFEFVVPAASTRFDDIVAAFDDATGKALRRLVEWTLTRADRPVAAR